LADKHAAASLAMKKVSTIQTNIPTSLFNIDHYRSSTKPSVASCTVAVAALTRVTNRARLDCDFSFDLRDEQ
jgi:hypothetical protein